MRWLIILGLVGGGLYLLTKKAEAAPLILNVGDCFITGVAEFPGLYKVIMIFYDSITNEPKSYQCMMEWHGYTTVVVVNHIDLLDAQLKKVTCP